MYFRGGGFHLPFGCEFRFAIRNSFAGQARLAVPVDQGMQHIGERVEIADESPEIWVSDNGRIVHDLLPEIDMPAERGNDQSPEGNEPPARIACAVGPTSISLAISSNG